MKLLILLFSLVSCAKFVEMTDDQFYETVNAKGQSHLNLIFSHNINGETHPCGCRKFPLGGLPQVNGVIKSLSKKAGVLYVDTGDTFFETTIVPDMIRKSSEFKAQKIAEALDLLELKLFTPGDQDFAIGEEFLTKLSQKAKFKFLISNSSNLMKIKHQKLARIDSNGVSLFFIGVLSPELLKEQYKKLFTSPSNAIREQLNQIKTQFPDVKNKKIILMSHSGLDTDKVIAKNFPEIDWVIGAHSQSFMRYSWDVGKTKIVQVLSRNHHLGHITIPFSPKQVGKYKLIETRDETKDLIKQNSMVGWLQDYKTQIDKIYQQEQNLDTPTETTPLPSYISCSDCHTEQVQFWQETSHAIAFSTLTNAKAANNPSCVKCHSLGFKQQDGFLSTKKIILAEDDNFNIDNYWKEFSKKIKIKHPISKLSKQARKKIAAKWMKLDKEQKVYQNYANVQCLNCHTKGKEHPFGEENGLKTTDFKGKCISCHTKDQSPSWYNKNQKGLATSLNDKYFAKKLKEVSCPKIEEK